LIIFIVFYNKNTYVLGIFIISHKSIDAIIQKTSPHTPKQIIVQERVYNPVHNICAGAGLVARSVMFMSHFTTLAKHVKPVTDWFLQYIF